MFFDFLQGGQNSQFDQVVLKPDFGLAIKFGVAAAVLGAAAWPVGFGAQVGVPIALLAILFAVRAPAIRFVFDPDALEVMTPDKESGGLKESGENFAVGGRNRWKYDTIEEWAMYPSPESPILVYFREKQTKPEGQPHLFPVLFEPDELKQLMVERVGTDKLVTSPPNFD
mmetsp:Transcript_168251/g.298106  ORF Transcript_168251/g.298106 Transcript_168251/m.298106 type:complete len:170 (-) Transcript_168251:111-620(-)